MVHQRNLANLTIALDAMGGDNAPDCVLKGAELLLSNYPNCKFLLYGDQEILQPLLPKFKRLNQAVEIIHTSKVILADDKPSTALRRGKDSSMWLAINAVYNNQAQAVVSAGNTGALMAISKLILKTIPQIHRPAIAGIMPSIRNNIVMLDLGANTECNADNLFQFAIMGEAFAKIMLNIESPTIGLLNIGSEEVKGNDAIKLAANMLRNSMLANNFIGYLEGNNIAEGLVNVVVADGFSGNIALKTAEGTAKICKEFIKQAFNSSIIAKLGFLLAKNALKVSTNRLDHRLYNGAMFLGLNGIVVKSHGSADEIGFANAIKIAIELATKNINQRIIYELESADKLISN